MPPGAVSRSSRAIARSTVLFSCAVLPRHTVEGVTVVCSSMMLPGSTCTSTLSVRPVHPLGLITSTWYHVVLVGVASGSAIVASFNVEAGVHWNWNQLGSAGGSRPSCTGSYWQTCTLASPLAVSVVPGVTGSPTLKVNERGQPLTGSSPETT